MWAVGFRGVLMQTMARFLKKCPMWGFCDYFTNPVVILQYVSMYRIMIQKGLILISSFKNKWLKDYYLDDKSSKKIPTDLEARLFRKLQIIDDATSDLDLRSPPSNHFEKLSGNLVGKHSIRVNGQWRLIFEWDGDRGEASKIYLDNHSYRG